MCKGTPTQGWRGYSSYVLLEERKPPRRSLRSRDGRGSTEVDTMARRSGKRFTGLVLAAALVVLGLPGTSSALSQTVNIRDNTFTPNEVRIDPGDRVIWRNNGAATHSATSELSESKGGFDSGKMSPG